MDILLLEPMMAEIESALDDLATVHRLDPTAALSPDARRAEIVVTGGATGIPRAMMDALGAIRLVAINGIGTDAVDLVEARRRGIAVTTTPGVLTDDVADMALALILSALRGIAVGDRFVRAGGWGRETLPLARKVSGCALGIVGMGQVGRAVAKRARAFDMTIAYHDLHDFGLEESRFVPSLAALASDSDILVVAAAGGAQSRGLIDADVLSALGPRGWLINVARGSIVDEEALVAALRDGRIAGAGLDVFAHEPAVPAALTVLDTVVLQPHRASATVETRRAMGQLVVDNVRACVEGRPLLTPVE
ncbi:D-isomer-specific 2-hydroxyacid dehydrogenase [Ameyamaea chiangmaiensis NBRC 103196]|uniref:2-hydroxyacid dehydrogenase n=1 Tax=Ameyamaea chiangmaiensis TaxID=442969 RepID=A0A850PH16_9PROT|nr:2-hydroxyacid dehydrogenase [Ameyamaea chiangmaiensis]MBS4075982.1 2-hydroxyacid dehydrogenase [Ameyamaea chiangmaiensis]NVN42113.1 2-hydroxyacid dehydrogenase [Ameyamaea chiangmaiensis]GBQ61548.1 D-isomer-specific 2-hydroxyacid dehydrogenase [Ameyamaea chiangmaiensis NBRC 103196]